jgi:FecR protein
MITLANSGKQAEGPTTMRMVCSHTRHLLALLFILATSAFVATPSFAACSLVADPNNAGASMLQCGAAITAHFAVGTVARPVSGRKSGAPTALRLNKGAALIEFTPQPDASSFQILTPEAIAAVRGTTWAVEVEPGKTSVLVVTGAVEVRPLHSRASAELGPGQGVDVARGDREITVKTWGEARVRALMARFGR